MKRKLIRILLGSFLFSSFSFVAPSASAIQDYDCLHWQTPSSEWSDEWVYNTCFLAVLFEGPIPGINRVYVNASWTGDVYYYPSGNPVTLGSSLSQADEETYPGTLDSEGNVNLIMEVDSLARVILNGIDVLEWDPYCWLGAWSYRTTGNTIVLYDTDTGCVNHVGFN